MQKLFKNCYEMDAKCYNIHKLNEDILMEHAANAMYKYICEKFSKGAKISIIAGAGNNGADGIALARQLYKEYKVKLFIPFGAKSKMAQIQLQRAKSIGIKIKKKLTKGDIYIDALFGAGLNRALNQESIKIITLLNDRKGFKLACDIPSGLNEKGLPSPIAFKADTTITMGALKEALYLDIAKDYVGTIKVANLGVARELYEESSDSFVLEKVILNHRIRNNKECHKGDFGI